MPQKILCSRCGYVFYSGIDLRPPEEIIQRYGGFCPSCGKKLVFETDRIEISPAKSA